ncbi:hypothetical protein ACFWVT_02005 [Streptomyces cyaneofuscatus]|uniref:hypothetical protein n=1 Tax=Streptomyces cyaneofuscatus TaxID=66883 RepID=UPI003648664D
MGSSCVVDDDTRSERRIGEQAGGDTHTSEFSRRGPIARRSVHDIDAATHH